MTNNKSKKSWHVHNPSDNPLDLTPTQLSIPLPILSIMANRGVTDSEGIRLFLNPSLDQLPAPQSLKGLSQAVEILAEARLNQVPVLVFGDYDADGVTATALLVKFFREINLPVFYHIPNRITDGYGLNCDTLALLRNLPGIAEHPAPVLVTVDCGISSILEIATAKNLGFRIIITDHHLPGPELPRADAIINPHQRECAFPFKELAGVGVAFFLAIGLRKKLASFGIWADGSIPNLKKYLDLVAIGTVADMVPLRGVNRILVKGGLEIINQNPCLGIKALIAQFDRKHGNVTAETISFYLAPRLNAAGRIGSAEIALQLLLTDSEYSALELAKSLSQANDTRKDLTEAMSLEAIIQAESQIADGRNVLIVSGDTWHQGIVGLVASRLARDYFRPAVAISFDGEGLARGSIRSIENLDIHKCLLDCEDILEKFGGHQQAAGITLKIENLTEFQLRFSESVDRAIGSVDARERLTIDIAADPIEILSENILKYLPLIEPCGTGNPGPIFCSNPKGIRLLGLKKVGANSMRFSVTVKGGEIKGIGFGMAEWISHAERYPVNITYKVCHNDYRGDKYWEIRVEDISKTD